MGFGTIDCDDASTLASTNDNPGFADDDGGARLLMRCRHTHRPPRRLRCPLVVDCAWRCCWQNQAFTWRVEYLGDGRGVLIEANGLRDNLTIVKDDGAAAVVMGTIELGIILAILVAAG